MNGCFIGTTTMEVKWLCLVLLLLGLSTLSNIQVYGQPDSLGFISIDCGLPEKSSYVDSITTIPYTSDEQFIDVGVNYNISAAYITPALSKRYLNVRSFTTGARNCYTLNSLLAGEKYLVRASFMYANYDGLNKLPIFDLYIGVNFWKTINVSDADSGYQAEVITVAPANYLQVCLINKGLGTPFISGLDMRPLKPILYPWVNATQSIVLYTRLNAGPIDDTIIRYPDDSHDRIWKPWSNEPYWAEISTASRVLNINNDHFEAPSAVMQTAVVPVNNASKIDFSWPIPDDDNLGLLHVMYFSEIQTLAPGAVRQFNIMINDKLRWGYCSPDYLYSDSIYSTDPDYGYRQYDFSIVATRNSTLPPLLNALEIFTALPVPLLGTDSGDVSAIAAIKAQYQVKRNWMGDPCAPQAYAWDGLSCSYSLSSPPTITSINLSSSGLTGAITTSFASLKSLQSLDLSYNNLTGPIPDALSQLPSLTFLDLRGNQLNGSIPPGLSKRSQDGTLTLRVDQCVNGNSCVPPRPKKKSPIVMVLLIVVVVLIVTMMLIICTRRKKRGSETNPSVRLPNERDSINVENKQDSPLQFENRQFTYKELELITSNFSQVLGKGGFGTVYEGILENGTPVAVKMCSHSASQGVKEFLAEAQHLTRVHHKNLVSMIGYCRDGDHLALVYEFMSEGTLEKHLKGEANARPLNWRQRVQIAYESAQGLEYLHKSCNPPINHRDVKTNNILLNSNLEAKLADFGLSKAFNSDINTHVSTAVVGTPGYLDPEYYTTLQLGEKSDVYSFGIVLLEIITGQPAILTGPEIIHIVQWVRQRLSRGNIENIVDPRMRGEYDINSVWKVAALGLECTAQPSIQRPTMTNIVMQLNECLELVNASERNHNKQYSRRDNFYLETSDSQIRTFKVEYTRQIPEGPGPVAR